jgi:NADH:ubiquinone oxidoreductase subunit F (NADH-binding)
MQRPVWDDALLGELAQAMRDASICGLGQTASSAVESAIARLEVFTSDVGSSAAPDGGASGNGNPGASA